MASKTRRKHRKNKPLKKKSAPSDDAGFAEFIRSLSRRIVRLVEHLSVIKNAFDYQSRQLLERLIDERGKALSSPPESISSGLVETLREEVRRG